MKKSLIRPGKHTWCFMALACFFTLAGETAIQAATFTVTRTDDRNAACVSAVDCSLREAVNAANSAAGDDIVNFAAGLTTITLTDEIVISNNGTLTITGLGANVLTVNGGPGTNRIFYTNTATVTITDLRLGGGNGTGAASSGSGGAIYVNSGTLTLDRIYFLGNGAGIGGALYIREGFDHRIKNSSFVFNSATACGAIMNDQSSSLLIANSTISSNSGGNQGGGFCGFVSSTKLRNVTISNNSANSAGGFDSISGSVQFANTIVAGNSAATFPEIRNQSFSVGSEGNNFVGAFTGASTDTDNAIPYQFTDIRDIDPKLEPAADNGGPTPTQALRTGSFAIDSGSNSRTLDSGEPFLTDQRGFLRIVDGDGNGTEVVDIGAYEFLSAIPTPKTFTVTRSDDRSNFGCSPGDCSLREAVNAAALRISDDAIEFAPSLTNITLTDQISINNIGGTLTINGPGANVLTINGGAGTNRIFYTDNATVAIGDLTLTGGNGTSFVANGLGGAIYANAGSLSLKRVHINGNSAPSTGGGVYLFGGTNHRIRNSTFSSNSAAGGAGLYVNGPVTVVNSTVSGNTATGGGGAISNEGNTTLRNVTITNNTAGQAGGILNTGSINFANSIIAGNNAVSSPEILCFVNSSTTSAGNNLVGDSPGDAGSTGFPIAYQPTDLLDMNPMLGVLQNNGGTTPTHALVMTSPAIDAGNNSEAVDPFNNAPLIVDQRDFQRIRDGNGDSSAIVDIGAYEFAAVPTAAGSTISGRVLTTDGTPLAGVVLELNGARTRRTITDSVGFYRFDEVQTNGFYTLTPSRANFSFNPGARSFSQIGNSTQAAFTASPAQVDTNPLDTPEYFVRQHYVDFLGREPDEAGFNFWSDQILSCGNDAGCAEGRRINVSGAYFLSIEFQRTGGLVDGLYRASYGRRPLYDEFIPDTASLARDVVVGRTGWEQQLESNTQAFINAWVQRSTFRSAYDNLSDGNYVDEVIRHTGVIYTQSERDALLSDLTADRLTRAGVLLRIANDERFVAGKRNETFVMMEYFGYLRRDPDEDGYQFWLTKLNQFNGNFERAEMVKAFINSGEYRARFPR